MNETTKILPFFALMVNFPSKSAEVPFCVPFTSTDAPANGPEPSVTTPETLIS